MLKVLILDKEDWLEPEIGPGILQDHFTGVGYASGGCVDYDGFGNGYGAAHCSGASGYHIMEKHENGSGYAKGSYPR